LRMLRPDLPVACTLDHPYEVAERGDDGGDLLAAHVCCPVAARISACAVLR
jgi:hypothetical protein